MNSEDFIERIFQKHQEAEKFPATSTTCKLMTKLMLVLFPEQSKKKITDKQQLETVLNNLGADLEEILRTIPEKWIHSSKDTAQLFLEELPNVYQALLEDIEAALKGDPAAVNELEVIRAYPGFYAIAFYRFAHILYQLKVPLIPRVITEYAHSKTGIDIHPGAKISPSFFIDHGTGVVIGETTEIGRNVKIYQGVTLGALSVSKDLAQTKRHPTIEENVVIYSGTTILGGETIIGANSIIGGNVWLTKSVPKNAKVYHQAETVIKQSTTIR
jgi:serine O-acetyltransferase